ncbi:superoxide dismutase family protein [Streptomyces sp. ACA25]|uniref:superoxide dismutase family protein n=1 Tax=Streptomyces sp. ACA25 TaxID=3022596 RepID=UPI002307D48B|nr:superoxide dismutase family protein [Streptomyces sp. ACA25]MDB1087769.1 superoxide dismutase family protein [Streptomyces sp. ACA25]
MWTAAVGTAMAAVLAGTGAGGTTAEAGSFWLRASGQFAPPATVLAPAAVTYDRELVPAGAEVEVAQRITDGEMAIELSVRGVLPGHAFGTHVHTRPCGPDPADSGPHYQHVEGDDSASANPENEVWLDFRADARGHGTAVSHHEWTFRAGGAASVVLHERETSHGADGHAPGEAGPRAACFTVPFAGDPALPR